MDAIDTIKILGSLLGSGGLSKGTGGDVLGNLLGKALSGSQNQPTQGGGMIGDLLGSLVGGGAKSTSGGGMADLLGGLLGSQKQNPQANASSGGGIGDLLGGLLGGVQSGQAGQNQQSGGGLGSLLGSLLGGSSASAGGPSAGLGGLGGLLTGALTKYAQVQNADVPNPTPSSTDTLPAGMDAKEAEAHALLLIKAMINAAKSDGGIDRAEQEKIIAKLGDITQAEADFVRNEMNKPLDLNAFVNEVPRGMEQQVYAVSLMAIDLDSQKEADYLAQLANWFSIDAHTANVIHEEVGAPKIFS